MSLKQAIAREPVTLAGIVIGLATFLLVRYAHMDADSAKQTAAGVIPLVGALIARQFVSPVTTKAGAASTVDDVVAVLQQIKQALTEPASQPVTNVPLPEPAAASVTATTAAPGAIPEPPEPWTPPALEIPPILGAMTATPAAPTVTDAPAPEATPA